MEPFTVIVHYVTISPTGQRMRTTTTMRISELVEIEAPPVPTPTPRQAVKRPRTPEPELVQGIKKEKEVEEQKPDEPVKKRVKLRMKKMVNDAATSSPPTDEKVGVKSEKTGETVTGNEEESGDDAGNKVSDWGCQIA